MGNLESSFKSFLCKNIYISAYTIHVKMKVTFKISETYLTYFSPKFNIKILSIRHLGLILPLSLRQNSCENSLLHTM